MKRWHPRAKNRCYNCIRKSILLVPIHSPFKARAVREGGFWRYNEANYEDKTNADQRVKTLPEKPAHKRRCG